MSAAPVSTNAPFNEVGQSMIQRDIEQLYLSISDLQSAISDNAGGLDKLARDVANELASDPLAPPSNSDQPTAGGLSPGTYSLPVITVGGAGSITAIGNGLPIYGGGGNARGSLAVDWQQARTLATQVASGLASTIIGGANNGSTGDSSVAGGQECLASGTCSLCIGFQAVASGDYSVALGYRTQATGFGDFAAGQSCSATGGDSVALGDSCAATGTCGVAAGFGCIAAGTKGAALGDGATAGVSGTGSGCVSIGYHTVSQNDHACSFGSLASALFQNSTAIGFNATAGATAETRVHGDTVVITTRTGTATISPAGNILMAPGGAVQMQPTGAVNLVPTGNVVLNPSGSFILLGKTASWQAITIGATTYNLLVGV